MLVVHLVNGEEHLFSIGISHLQSLLEKLAGQFASTGSGSEDERSHLEFELSHIGKPQFTHGIKLFLDVVRELREERIRSQNEGRSHNAFRGYKCPRVSGIPRRQLGAGMTREQMCEKLARGVVCEKIQRV